MTSCFSNSRPTFQPAMRLISAITNSEKAIVTTNIDHNYITGEIVRLDVPKLFGMQQIDGLYEVITVIASDQFEINIDTRKFDPFAIPVSLPTRYTCAQVIPIAEVNSILTAATKNVLPSGVR